MNFWKSLAIALAILLGISYVGFAYVYSQGGGIIIAGMVTYGSQPKVITLLRNSNITESWNVSVNVEGYKTGFLYCKISQTGPGLGSPFVGPVFSINVQFETDGILGEKISLSGNPAEISIAGTRMWISVIMSYQWVVMSMSLYLRD